MIPSKIISTRHGAMLAAGSKVNKHYTITLNNNWQLSNKPNPDSSLYDGVYESYSNKGVHNTAATMYIDIVGYSDFDLYIRSYAESNYDYVMVSQLDQTINNNTSYNNSTLVKAHTRGNQNSGTALVNYTLVQFTGIDGGSHRITVVYRKDSSASSNDDCGYLLIEKSIGNNINTIVEYLPEDVLQNIKVRFECEDSNYVEWPARNSYASGYTLYLTNDAYIGDDGGIVFPLSISSDVSSQAQNRNSSPYSSSTDSVPSDGSVIFIVIDLAEEANTESAEEWIVGHTYTTKPQNRCVFGMKDGYYNSMYNPTGNAWEYLFPEPNLYRISGKQIITLQFDNNGTYCRLDVHYPNGTDGLTYNYQINDALTSPIKFNTSESGICFALGGYDTRGSVQMNGTFYHYSYIENVFDRSSNTYDSYYRIIAKLQEKYNIY